MSNFTFLKTEWPDIYQSARHVEEYIRSDPRSACFHARRGLELTVQWLYTHDRAFLPPYENNLAALLYEPCFRQNVPDAIYTKAQLLRKMGNQAVHSDSAISAQSALGAAVELYHILYWLARTYTQSDLAELPQNFDEKLLPPPAIAIARQSLARLKKQQEELRAIDEALLQERQENADLKEQLAAFQNQVARQKSTNQAIPDDHDYSEAETRKKYINLLLVEAGWDPAGPNVAEYRVEHMPTPSGIGYVDYVLWGDDALPLALVEAKRTSVDPRDGQQQAKLYANSLQEMHGQRPIIFYSNGYDTYLWDDKRYPPRQVQGFYTKDELMLLIQQRETAQPLEKVSINEAIVNRPYQEAAIRQMTDHFSRHHRKGLLVMATGTGKTRVAIALVDLLMTAGWIKRVLFLADRSALVRQAANAFKTHLPSTNPVNLLDATGKEQAASARVVISTYHTMMNLIDEIKTETKSEAGEGGQKLFSVGHFDLVLVDEAHRSIYQKFGAIFTYFDSLLVGLTATPKDEVDRNTYRLFGLEDGEPTFAYGLEEAIADGYLVPYRAYALPTKFIEQGIKYAELSDDEKEEWERLDWNDSEEIPDAVSASAINQWLFNEETVDLILKSLMEHGLKVAGGDRLGKTIIFAKNHKHAQFIAERFGIHYPDLKGTFASVIDTYISHVQSAIDDFSQPEKEPHIAISVDMLDTGIDVPEVVNLLFFKVVRSKTKFFQMIGRGTRLRPELYGPDDDKTHFLIFDACLNFEFFDQHPEGAKSSQPEPLSQSLFKRGLTLLVEIRRLAAADPELASLATALADSLHATVVAMNTDNFIVRDQRAYVEPFQARSRWETLSQADINELTHHVSGLPTARQSDDDEGAKRFDLLLLDLQLAHIDQSSRFNALRDKIITLAVDLAGQTNIPAVNEQRDFLLELQSQPFWLDIDLSQMEEIRQRLRGLIPFANKSEQKVIYTAFKDQGQPLRESQVAFDTSTLNALQYKKQVQQFIQDHREHPLIQKIHWGLPLTLTELETVARFFYEAEEIGGQEQFVQMYGVQENLATFLRTEMGLDPDKAEDYFAQFLDDKRYSPDQIRFVRHIIQHLTANGTLAPARLYEQPYTDVHHQGLNGLFFEEEAAGLLNVIKEVNVVIDSQNDEDQQIESVIIASP